MSAKILDGAGSSADNRDRRRHPRYSVERNALLYNQEHFAEILNISVGGLACRCLVESDIFGSEVNNVDLLDCNGGKNVQGLKCRRVRHGVQKAEQEHDRYLTREHFFEFVDLCEEKTDELLQFILSCTSGSAGGLKAQYSA